MTITQNNVAITSGFTVKETQERDTYLIDLLLSSVTRENFGNYTVQVNNGIGSGIFIYMELRERGIKIIILIRHCK